MIGQIVAQSVGIVVEPARIEKIEGWIRIGESLLGITIESFQTRTRGAGLRMIRPFSPTRQSVSGNAAIAAIPAPFFLLTRHQSRVYPYSALLGPGVNCGTDSFLCLP